MDTLNTDFEYDYPFKILDIDNIWKTLWQGSAPPIGNILVEKGFTTLVLAAKEFQRADLYPDVEVLLAPSDDDCRFHRMMQFVPMWENVARQVAQRVKNGDKVLVTCLAGLNRSGFITTLALMELTKWDGKTCVKHVRSRRQDALCNECFRDYLSSLPAITK